MAETHAGAAAGRIVEVERRELPFSCPSRQVDAASIHPRVYIPLVESGGRAVCPYCGTEYVLED